MKKARNKVIVATKCGARGQSKVIGVFDTKDRTWNNPVPQFIRTAVEAQYA